MKSEGSGRPWQEAALFLLTAIGMRITWYGRVLGKGGEQHVEELLAKIEEGAKNQPVVMMKMIGSTSLA
jgi:hypothetical protein